MKSSTWILGSILAMSGLTAPAQEGGFTASLGLTAAQGSSSTLTRQTWGGLTLEGGYRVAPQDFGAVLEPYIGWGRMPGKGSIPDRSSDSLWGPNTYDLTFLRVGLDIRMKPIDGLPVTMVFGPSFHNWKVHRVGGGADIPQGGDGTAIKMGWRLGLDIAIDQHWSASLRFTQSEWRSEQSNVYQWPGYQDQNKTPSYIQGLNPSRPAYFTLAGTYRF